MYAGSMNAEVRETLSRHGMTDADIDRVAEFEARAKTRKRSPRVHPEPLDFGDWV